MRVRRDTVVAFCNVLRRAETKVGDVFCVRRVLPERDRGAATSRANDVLELRRFERGQHQRQEKVPPTVSSEPTHDPLDWSPPDGDQYVEELAGLSWPDDEPGF